MVLAHFDQRRDVSPNNSPSSASPDLLHDPLRTLNSNTYLASSIPPQLELSYIDFSTADDDDLYAGSNQSSPFEQSAFPPFTSETQLMTGSPSQNPRLHVQQSTPGAADLPYSPPPMSGGSYQGWSNIQDWSHLSPQAQQQYSQPVFSAHKRLSSESSVGSAGPASPYTLPATYPHIVDTETQSVNSPHFDTLDTTYSSSAQFIKPLPAHTSPLNNGTLFHQAYNLQPDINNAGQYIAQQSAMRQAMRGQRGNSKSGARNASSEQSVGGEYEGSENVRPAPNLDRTMSDVYQDELYNPSMQQPRPSPLPNQSQQSQVSLLSPSYRQTFNERLQAANAARSASPTSIARERSPFRENSEFASQEFAQDPSSPARINSARQIREAQKLQADARAYKDHHPQISSHDFASPNTISPKEVSLDYHESEDESKNFPLFPQSNLQVKEQNGFSVNSQGSQNQYNTARSGPSSYPTASLAQQSSSQLTFMPPSVPGTNVPNTYPFISHSRRQSSSLRSQNSPDQALEFPTTLSSMESTKSDSGSGEIVRPTGFGSQSPSREASSQDAPPSSSSPHRRPSDTSANAGTYTCVAPSCTARFDTSAKLQRHRRDAHPSITTNAPAIRASASPYNASNSPATPSSMANSQAAANNISRNNQPGPHKCERINPSTGKPCNTIFSRSYDLTRHEDTIHSNRKHKVRCHLCVEEKTFSRNDALTRHMRVVHPEVDMGGKGKRGGRS